MDPGARAGALARCPALASLSAEATLALAEAARVVVLAAGGRHELAVGEVALCATGALSAAGEAGLHGAAAALAGVPAAPLIAPTPTTLLVLAADVVVDLWHAAPGVLGAVEAVLLARARAG